MDDDNCSDHIGDSDDDHIGADDSVDHVGDNNDCAGVDENGIQY